MDRELKRKLKQIAKDHSKIANTTKKGDFVNVAQVFLRGQSEGKRDLAERIIHYLNGADISIIK